MQRTVGNHAVSKLIEPRDTGVTRGGIPPIVQDVLNDGHECAQTKRVGSGDLRQTTAPPIVHAMLRSPGQPLEPATRTFMEARFGRNFAQVRLHTDATADDLSRRLQARAFTTGTDIFFRDGVYDPQSRAGRRSLAHELVHVAQQNGQGTIPLQRVSQPGDADEVEAEAVADRATSTAISVIPLERKAGSLIQREVDDRTAQTSTNSPTPAAHGGQIKVYNLTFVADKRTYSYNALPEAEAIKALTQFSQKIRNLIDVYQKSHQETENLRHEHSVVSFWSDTIGRADYPDIEMWDEPYDAWFEARTFLAAREEVVQRKFALERQAREQMKGTWLGEFHIPEGRIERAAYLLQIAADKLDKCARRLSEYRRDTEKGGERAVTGLKVTATVGAVAATVATGGLAAGAGLSAAGTTGLGLVAGAGYSGAQNLAQQMSEKHYGLRDKIDWAGVGFDAAIGAVTGYMGGKLGGAVLKRLLANPATASISKRALAQAVNYYIADRTGGSLHLTARLVFDRMRGQNVTWEQYLDAMADQFTDPKQAALGVILGHATHVAGARVEQTRAVTPTIESAGQPPPTAPESVAGVPHTDSSGKTAAPKVEPSEPTPITLGPAGEGSTAQSSTASQKVANEPLGQAGKSSVQPTEREAQIPEEQPSELPGAKTKPQTKAASTSESATKSTESRDAKTASGESLPRKVPSSKTQKSTQPKIGRRPRASTRSFLKDVLQKISDPNHPLHFLVVKRSGPSGEVATDWRKTTRTTKSGKIQTGRYPGSEEGPVIQVGHQGAHASGAPEQFMLEDADFNVTLGGDVIESKGAFSAKTAVLIDGVPVDIRSALQWERIEGLDGKPLLPKGTVARSPKIEPPDLL